MSKNREEEFTLKMELRFKGYGSEKHKTSLAQRVVRVLETAFGKGGVTCFQIDAEGGGDGRVKHQVRRDDRNAESGAT